MQSLQKFISSSDWSVGVLNRYADVLRENFDTPDQILEIYGGTDGQQFCDDLGIEEPEHRKIFERWFATLAESGAAAASEKGSNGKERMRHIDWSTGDLQCYARLLQENFDTPEQLAECYRTRLPDGSEVFDVDAFFEDLGIEDQLHRMLFRSWFDTLRIGPTPTACPSATASAGVPVAADPGQVFKSASALKDWVWSKDWSIGSLSRYADALEETFDGPWQLAAAYMDGNGSGKVFDSTLFFKDAGIEDSAHQDLFRAWIAKEHGALMKRPS